MRDNKNSDQSGEKSSGRLENTRREFLGATAGAGIASKLWGVGEDEAAEGPQDVVANGEDPVEMQEELSEEAGVFDIRDYGAVGDGETDNSQAIYDAIEAAAEVQGTVLIPHGDWVTDWIILRHEHSGITIQGLGYGSCLVPLQAVNREAAWTWEAFGNKDQNYTRGIMFNDSFSPPEGYPSSLGAFDFNYRDPSPIRNITIRDLRLDGRKDEMWDIPVYDSGTPETPLDAPTGFGINLGDQDAPDNRNNSVHNIWTHDWMYNGLMIYQGGANASNVMTWNNGFHGVGLGGPLDADSSAANLSNVVAHKNGQYGIDSTQGATQITNFSCFNNGWGMKLAGPDRASLVNGKLIGNLHQGMQMTNPTEQCWMNNLESRNNGGGGFHFWQKGQINIGQITADNNNQSTEPTQFSDSPRKSEEILVTDGMTVIADQIRVKDSLTSGLRVRDGEFRVDDLQVTGSEVRGVVHEGGEFIVKGGVVRDNGAAGALQGGLRSHITKARIEDDVGIDIQDGVGPVTLRDLDMRKSSTPVQIAEGVRPEIENVTGYVTEDSGRATYESGGYDKTYTVEHSLSTTPDQVRVMPDASSDATQVVGVKSLSEDSFEFELKSVPKGSGKSDDENVAVYWDASAF